MIFNTLLPHANALIENNQVGEDCFLLDYCRFGVEQFRESFEQNSKQNNPKTKLNLPVIFFGKKVKALPGRFQGNNAANASKNTFQKKKSKDDMPEKWFPWLQPNKNSMHINDFLSLMQKFNIAEPEKVYELFTINGSLFTFQIQAKKKNENKANILENMVAGSVYQTVTCDKPTLAVHSTLALNGLNENAELFDEKKDESLIRKELFKFCLLFWMLNHISSLTIKSGELEKRQKPVKVEPKIIASGNTGDISALPLLLNTGNFHLGVHTEQAICFHPVVKKFFFLTREDAIDRISLTRSSKVFTAPATGKAPTNAYKIEGKNVLISEVRLGFDRSIVNRLLPAYSNLIQNKTFSLSHTALKYYVFPEDVSLTTDYLDFLEDMISQLNRFREEYFNWIKKSSSSPKAKEERKEALKRIQEQRKAFWEKSWNKFNLSELLFAFEENVGSINQAQYAWTSVYRHLPSAKAFLFLEMLDDPSRFGRLMMLLNHTSLNLSEGWKEKEIKRLFDRYFLSGRLVQFEFWMRWRKYLSRSNVSEAPIDARLWEEAISLIIQIRAMSKLGVKVNWTGKELLKHLEKRRREMDAENRAKIQKYLTDIFLPGEPEQVPEKEEKGTIKVRQFIKQQANNYAVFVDTESESWETIIDGLVCGWALKQICLKIRNKEYASVIGGKSLAKHTPAQLRTLSINLFSKAERASATPWNVQAPLEWMFKWAQKNPHTPEVLLFMDAVSLGFMRYDNPTEAAKKGEAADHEMQSQGSEP